MKIMNSDYYRAATLATILAIQSPVTGAVELAAVRPYLEFGLEFGGDTLAEEPGGYGTVNTDAGAGFSVSGGALFDLEGERLNGDILVTAGIIDNSGDEADFSTTRLDLVYLFDIDSSLHRFGIGPTFHINPRLKIDPDSSAGCTIFCFDSSFPVGTTDFDDAVGLTLRYEINLLPDWHPGGGITLGIRYTMIEYESDVEDVDAGGVGLYLNIF